MEEPVLIINLTGAAPVTERVFGQAGIVTETVSDLTTAAVRLAGGKYRVAVLLAEGDDVPERCALLREAGNVPLIVISPGMSTIGCVAAIQAGADVCLRRAYGPLELIARVRALGMRRVAENPAGLVS